MNVLITVLLTVIAIGNIGIISAIAWALRSAKDKNSRIAGIVLLSHIVINSLAILGGSALW